MSAAYLAEAARRARARSRASLMSDTKWRKLFIALDDSGLGLHVCVFKFIDETAERRSYRPTNANLYPPRPWIDASFGPMALRSLEWILFPRVVEHRPNPDRTIPLVRTAQEVDGAAGVIAALGKYPIELSEAGLLIRGYLTAEAAGPT